MFLRKKPKGQEHLRRFAGRHGKSKAPSILAHRVGRAAYFMLKHQRAFDQARFLKM